MDVAIWGEGWVSVCCVEGNAMHESEDASRKQWVLCFVVCDFDSSTQFKFQFLSFPSTHFPQQF